VKPSGFFATVGCQAQFAFCSYVNLHSSTADA
jgi:hypothetical protein